MTFGPLYNDHIHRATQQSIDQQGDPTYSSPTKLRCRRTEERVTGGSPGDAATTQTVITTAQIDAFSETDLIWLSEDDETDEAEGHEPETVGFSETLGHRLARAKL